MATVALGSTVVSAVVSQIMTWVKERRRERKVGRLEAMIAAIKVISHLEDYAIQCSGKLNRNVRLTKELGPHEADGRHDLDFPGFKDLSGLGLRHLDSDIAAKVLIHGSQVALMSSYLNDCFENCIPSEFVARFNEQLGFFGYEAWKLAKKTRAEYDLPKLEIESNVDFTGSWLESYAEAALKNAEKRQSGDDSDPFDLDV
ncbi:TPA: hypothetical protein QDC20_005700 [Burkholderia aenigmatica]|uniref:hypothetical protein n=1 Tax=Burkholderia sp. AU45251 TaxID=3059204 RepID=UPI00264D4808|nr:hypothetical protein [Burkholderia sp. AU45251]HDR9482742.1 hypothetical protein [Burkholderia aenigmatica]MDN7519574.1 hypothetical protein [Burkholderia sp. AU45251]HDR9513689.1 hypothetical protein [Burkholderia aenigmatica]HDR9591080.1 hypothetical protein [Burkholderia aenigmatica]HDR9599062.1 hypothetical protein [Burkholderia aenigmatica]